MAEEIHVGDIGTVFRITVQESDVALDISDATTLQMLFYKPNRTVATKTAVFTDDGTDGQIQYTTVEDDLDQSGTWKVQARITTPDGVWSSSIGRFKVYGNLDA